MTALPVRLPPELTEDQRRAIRRNLNALPDLRAELAQKSKTETVTDILRQFENGEHNLFGAPRRLVDFPHLYEQLAGR